MPQAVLRTELPEAWLR
jgi:hypothetical protein